MEGFPRLLLYTRGNASSCAVIVTLFDVFGAASNALPSHMHSGASTGQTCHTAKSMLQVEQLEHIQDKFVHILTLKLLANMHSH